MNCNFNFVLQGYNRLWIVSVTLIFKGSPQKIVKRGQITASQRPIDIRISTGCFIFENSAPKIDCYASCVASGPVLLEPNVVHVILFNFWEQKSVEHSSLTLAIDRNSESLLILKEKWPYWPFAQAIENVLKNWFDRIGYCKGSHGSHLNDVVFDS